MWWGVLDYNYLWDEHQFCSAAVVGGPRDERTGSAGKSNSRVRVHPDWWSAAVPARGAAPDHPLRRETPQVHGRMEHKVPLLLRSHHQASGLYNSCMASTLSVKQAEEQIIGYLLGLGIGPGQLTIAGNSVHMDKLFLFHHMPRLNQFLHYRILDVSSIKTVVNALHPQLFFKKKNSHRALDDIRESIGELCFYMQYAFKWFWHSPIKNSI